jgi:hypothetical protein
MDTSDKWLTLDNRGPDLGVKGSGVQVSPARLNPSTLPTQSDLHLTDILATLDNAERQRSGLATEHKAEKAVPAFTTCLREMLIIVSGLSIRDPGERPGSQS